MTSATTKSSKKSILLNLYTFYGFGNIQFSYAFSGEGEKERGRDGERKTSPKKIIHDPKLRKTSCSNVRMNHFRCLAIVSNRIEIHSDKVLHRKIFISLRQH